jgi:hypothetical protein
VGYVLMVVVNAKKVIGVLVVKESIVHLDLYTIDHKFIEIVLDMVFVMKRMEYVRVRMDGMVSLVHKKHVHLNVSMVNVE